MDAEARHRTLQLLGIEMRKVPRDGDGDGFYSPHKGAPDKTPVPPRALRRSIAAAAAQWHSDLSDHGELIAAIDSGEKERFSLRGGQMGDVHLVDHNNGASTIEKHLLDVSNTMGPGVDPERQADAEQLAAALGRAIGAPVPRVLRTGDDKVTIDVVEGDTWAFIEDQIPNPTGQDKATLKVVKDQLVTSRDGIRLGLFDLLTDNWDRANAGNWYVEDGTNRPVGIDHAFAWSEGSDPAEPPAGWALGPFAETFTETPTPRQRNWMTHLKAPPLDWIDNPLTDDDIDWLRERLAELEDDFDRLGHHDWWEFAMARLDAIAEYAAGEESIFT